MGPTPTRFPRKVASLPRGEQLDRGSDVDFTSAQISACRAETPIWRLVETAGVPPPPRAHVKTMVDGAKVWLYGGTRKGVQSNDLYLLDFGSGTTAPTWSSPLVLGRPPCARFGESAVLMDEAMYVFGGYGNEGAGFVRFNTTHRLLLGGAAEVE